MWNQNPNGYVMPQFNINSIRKEFAILKEGIGDMIDIWFISETKIDDTFSLN